MQLSRTHRTAVFVDVSADTPGFRERVARLVQSLNGPNIKADIYSVDASGNISTGVMFPDGATAATDDLALTELARENGYVQTIVVRNCQND